MDLWVVAENGGEDVVIKAAEVHIAGGTPSVDYVAFSDDDTDFNMVGNSKVDWNISGFTAINVGAGIDFRIYDGTDTDYLSILHNGTNCVIETNSGTGGAISLGHQGVGMFQTQVHTTTGNTVGAQVKAHSGSFHDIGFNVLPTFNFNATDTLEAQHCGHSTGKDNTSAYTLTGPASSDVDFPVGGVCSIMNLGASVAYTIADTATCTMYIMDGSSVTDIAGTASLAAGGMCTLYRYSTTAIYLWGMGLT